MVSLIRLLAPVALLAATMVGGCAVYPVYPGRPYAAAFYGPPAPPVYGWRGRYWR